MTVYHGGPHSGGPYGSECPACGCPESRVIKSRVCRYTRRATGRVVTCRTRRRECDHCGIRFTTREEVLPGSQSGDPAA